MQPLALTGFRKTAMMPSDSRQKGRDVNDAVLLCDHGERILAAHIAKGLKKSELQENKNLLNLIRAGVRLTRAGLRTANPEWSKAVTDIRDHLQGLPNSAQEWFTDSLETLENGPDIVNCVRVISRLPYL